MSLYISRPPGVEIDAIVEEAVLSLGYFRPEALADTIDLMKRNWAGGLAGYRLRASGDDLTAQEKHAAKIGEFYLARQVWDMLTETGRQDPVYATDATCLRITFNVRRAVAQKEEAWRLSHIPASTAEFRGVTDHACAHARGLDGRTAALDDRCGLPLPNCTTDWCACRWDLIPDFD